jgi:phosphoribosylaminoimidazole-succinocarboxamide synthase
MFAKCPAYDESLLLSDEAETIDGYRLWHPPAVKYQKKSRP